MTNLIGQTVSHYKILEKLGAAVVSKAQETKLDRFVAVKFLYPRVSSSGDDNTRFPQGAMAPASMTHPDICTIHAGEEQDGQAFLVWNTSKDGAMVW